MNMQIDLFRIFRRCQVLQFSKSVLQLVQICMEKQKQKANKPKRYAKIPIEARMKLAQLVLQELQPVRKASKKLSIKLSTAKLILRKYREDGTFFEKRVDRLARLRAQREAQEIINSSNTIVEEERIIMHHNDLPMNPTPDPIYCNIYMADHNDFSFLNSPLQWNYYGIFPTMNPYMSGNYFYYC